MSKKVLVIGGSDPYAGGGLQTDLKTLENYQVFGLSVITCIATMADATFRIHDVERTVIEEQLASLPIAFLDGIKLGLIHQTESIPIIQSFLKKQRGIPVILDPVLAFKETKTIYEADYCQMLLKELAPLATCLTPNVTEAELLLNQKITTRQEMEQAAETLYQQTGTPVVIKGGQRLEGDKAIDVFFDGQQKQLFTLPKIQTETSNGAGCSFASAITAGVVKGASLAEAIKTAKHFVYESLQMGVSIESIGGSVWHQGIPQEKKGEQND